MARTKQITLSQEKRPDRYGEAGVLGVELPNMSGVLAKLESQLAEKEDHARFGEHTAGERR